MFTADIISGVFDAKGVMTMKRLMLVCVMFLCLAPVSGWAESSTIIDETAARGYAHALLSAHETGYSDIDIQNMIIQQDRDCWICELPADSNGSSGYLIIFDDNGMIHRYQNLSCELPDCVYADYDFPLSEEGNLFLKEANLLTSSWLDGTPGGGYDAFILAQQVSADTWLFSIDEMSRYVLVSRKGDSCTILAYGRMTASYGAYGDHITRDEAIRIAGKAIDSFQDLSVLFVCFDGPEMCWNIVLCSQGFDADMPNRGYFISVQAQSGEIIKNEYLGSGLVPLYWQLINNDNDITT